MSFYLCHFCLRQNGTLLDHLSLNMKKSCQGKQAFQISWKLETGNWNPQTCFPWKRTQSPRASRKSQKFFPFEKKVGKRSCTHLPSLIYMLIFFYSLYTHLDLGVKTNSRWRRVLLQPWKTPRIRKAEPLFINNVKINSALLEYRVCSARIQSPHC